MGDRFRGKRAIVTGSVKFRGRQLIGLPNQQMQPIRGARIAMILATLLARASIRDRGTKT